MAYKSEEDQKAYRRSEGFKRSQSKYYQENKEKRRESHKNWIKKNPEKAKEYSRRAAVKRREWFNSLKTEPCSDCGKSYPPRVMHFHHLDQNTKKFNISSAVHANYKSRKSILEEIEKCIILCANCHLLRHCE